MGEVSFPAGGGTQEELSLAVERMFDSGDGQAMEMGRQLKSKLQLSLGVPAEVAVCHLLERI